MSAEAIDASLEERGWLYRHETPPLPEFFERKLRVLEQKARAASPAERAQVFASAYAQTCKWQIGVKGSYDTLRWRFKDLADELDLFDVAAQLIDQVEQKSIERRPAWLTRTLSFDPKPFILRDPAKIPRRQWLYGTAYIRDYVSALVAPPGVGKSSLALVEAVAMASGKNILGVAPTERCRVWYCNLEDPLEEIERRVTAICLHHGLQAPDLEGWLFITGSETKIVVAHETSDGVMIVTPVIDALIDALDQQFDVMILDPFVRSHGVKENSNEAIDRVVATLADAARMTNIAIGLVHHTHKLYGVKVTMEASRGASSMVGAIRAGRVLDVMSEQEAKNFGFSERARFSYFRAEDGKTSMSKRAESADWYEIVSVGLGNGSGSLLDDQDRVGVVAKWEPLDLLADVTGGDFDKAATAIRGGRWRENAQAKDWAGRAIAMALSLDLDKPGDKAKVKALLKMWLGSDALIVVEEHDEKSMLRKFVKVANDED